MRNTAKIHQQDQLASHYLNQQGCTEKQIFKLALKKNLLFEDHYYIVICLLPRIL